MPAQTDSLARRPFAHRSSQSAGTGPDLAGGQRRRRGAEPAPAARTTGAGPALEQGRHSQLRRARDASEAGRHLRDWWPRCGSRRRSKATSTSPAPQLCGLAHYRMRGIVTVESAQAFARFLSDELRRVAVIDALLPRFATAFHPSGVSPGERADARHAVSNQDDAGRDAGVFIRARAVRHHRPPAREIAQLARA